MPFSPSGWLRTTYKSCDRDNREGTNCSIARVYQLPQRKTMLVFPLAVSSDVQRRHTSSQGSLFSSHLAFVSLDFSLSLSPSLCLCLSPCLCLSLCLPVSLSASLPQDILVPNPNDFPPCVLNKPLSICDKVSSPHAQPSAFRTVLNAVVKSCWQLYELRC